MTPVRYRDRGALPLALVSGILLALSFPRFGHALFAWIALAPLLVALRRGSLARAFGLGLATGAVYFTGTVYWITGVMVVYGNLPAWVAMPVNASLIATLAFFPALFAVVVRRSVMAYGPRAVMAAPLVWVATELGRTYLLGGFPWVLLGYSQVSVLPIAQLASLFGVYGVSALVASVSAGLAIVVISEGPATAGHHVPAGLHVQKYGAVVVAVTLVVIVAAWGSRRAATAEWTRTGDPYASVWFRETWTRAQSGIPRAPRRSSRTTSG